MGYGVLQSYGFSLRTELVDTKIHGVLQVMGFHEDGLGQSRLYSCSCEDQSPSAMGGDSDYTEFR